MPGTLGVDESSSSGEDMPSGDGYASRLLGLRVMVVDDSPINLEVIRRILAEHGAEVLVYESGAAAIEALGRWPDSVDVILMDLQMPDLDGCATTQRIREQRGSSVRVIALSTGSTQSDRQRATQAGMVDFLTKPVMPDEIVRVLRATVKRR